MLNGAKTMMDVCFININININTNMNINMNINININININNRDFWLVNPGGIIPRFFVRDKAAW